MTSRMLVAAFAAAVALHGTAARAQMSAGGGQGFDATTVDLEELPKINVRAASVTGKITWRF
jgi:hypothetical protein